MESKPSESRALVVVDEEALISPDHKSRIINLFQKNNQSVFLTDTVRQNIGLASIAGIFLALLFAIFGFVDVGLLLALIAIGLAAIGFFTAGSRDSLVQESSSLPLPCPLCNENINLVDPWRCGNCKHEHNVDGRSPRAIPFLPCLHSACNHADQTAFQCPHCHHHIVLDKSRYIADKCFEAPYRYVARYSSDTSSAIPHRPKTASGSSAFDDEGSVFDD